MKDHRAYRLLLILPLAAALGLAACSDADDVDSGGVSLVISDFDGLPTLVSVNAAAGVGLVIAEEIELESIVQNPNQGVGNLQTIELSTYEVRYSRADTGIRLPTPLVAGLIGTVPPGGTTLLGNLPILRPEQIFNPPISDLLFVNGGFDKETGSEVIALNLTIRFFGRTLGGRDVVSNPQTFLVDFVP